MSEQKQYPVEFVKRAKAEYPNWPSLHLALDSGSEVVGRCLYDSSSVGISPAEVVKMIGRGQVQELLEKADKLVCRQKLHRDWRDIAEKMFCT